MIGILGYLFYMPWTWSTWMIFPILLNVVLAFLVLFSEFAEIFTNKDSFVIPFKLINTPKKVIKLGKSNKSYYIDIVDINESFSGYLSRRYVVIYKRIFPFWIRLYKSEVSLHDYDPIEEIERRVTGTIDDYERDIEYKRSERKREKDKKKREKEQKRTSRSKLSKWDGLVGDEGKKTSYKRGKRLDQILKK